MRLLDADASDRDLLLSQRAEERVSVGQGGDGPVRRRSHQSHQSQPEKRVGDRVGARQGVAHPDDRRDDHREDDGHDQSSDECCSNPLFVHDLGGCIQLVTPSLYRRGVGIALLL